MGDLPPWATRVPSSGKRVKGRRSLPGQDQFGFSPTGNRGWLGFPLITVPPTVAIVVDVIVSVAMAAGMVWLLVAGINVAFAVLWFVMVAASTGWNIRVQLRRRRGIRMLRGYEDDVG